METNRCTKTIEGEVHYNLVFTKGWNYFSIPIEGGISFQQLNKECRIQYIYVRKSVESPEKQEYKLVPYITTYQLMPGTRYIVYSKKPCSLAVKGKPWRFPKTELKANQWRIIAGPFEPVLVKNILGSCREKDFTIVYYDYNKKENHISYPTILTAGKTYFVKSIQDCSLEECKPFTCEDLNWECGSGTEPECNTAIECGGCFGEQECQYHKCITIHKNCADGTPYEECSGIQPFYCDNNGALVKKCSECGCPGEQQCNTETEKCGGVEWPVPPFDSYGDVDDDALVTEEDALLILKSVKGEIELTEEQQRRADVTGNGTVDFPDAIEIIKYIEEKIDTFDVCSKAG